MDVKEKLMSAEEIRVELARRQITRKQLAEALGCSYQYMVEIVLGKQHAYEMRERIGAWLRRAG